ncbi:hypothetical protein N336_00342, partial [Phalacrocorax carbo]
VTVRVPFSVTDLRSWKELAAIYREDLEKVGKTFETIVRTEDPDWNGIQVVLDTLLTLDERTMVLDKAKEEAERIHAQSSHPGTVNDRFLSVDPQWDPNNLAQRELLTKYQRLVMFGIKYAIPKTLKLSKLDQVIQGKDEPPSEFYE